MIKTLIFSLITGTCIGFLYGLVFVKSQRQAQSLGNHILFTLVRFSFLTAAGIYLLVLPSIQPIILVLSFLATFWLVILTHKALGHERCGTSKH